MDHRENYLELISAAIDGALSPSEQEKLNAHLDVCPHCRVLYDELEALHDTLNALPPMEPPAGLTEQIMANLAAHKVVPLPVKKKAPVVWQRWMAAAATFAVILAGAWSVSRTGSDDLKQSLPEAASYKDETADFSVPDGLESMERIAPMQGDTAVTEGVQSTDDQELQQANGLAPSDAPEFSQKTSSGFGSIAPAETPAPAPASGDTMTVDTSDLLPANEETSDEDLEETVSPLNPRTFSAVPPQAAEGPEASPSLTEEELAAMAKVRACLNWPDDCIWDSECSNLWITEAYETRLVYCGLQLDGQYYYFEVWDVPLFIEEPLAGTRLSRSYAVSVDNGEVLESNEENSDLFDQIFDSLYPEP